MKEYNHILSFFDQLSNIKLKKGEYLSPLIPRPDGTTLIPKISEQSNCK